MLTLHEAALKLIRKRRTDYHNEVIVGVKNWDHYQKLVAMDSALAWVEHEMINLHRQGEEMDE